MLELDDLLLDLFDQELKACHVMPGFLVFTGHVLAESYGAFVVHVERCWLQLFVSQFLEDLAEVDDVFRTFDGRVDFSFGGAERDHLLFLTSCMENAGVRSKGEGDS